MSEWVSQWVSQSVSESLTSIANDRTRVRQKQFKVQIIGILEEIDSFYWPKMHLWKGDKKYWQGPSPPLDLDKIHKNSSFFSWRLPFENVFENWRTPGEQSEWQDRGRWQRGRQWREAACKSVDEDPAIFIAKLCSAWILKYFLLTQSAQWYIWANRAMGENNLSLNDLPY